MNNIFISSRRLRTGSLRVLVATGIHEVVSGRNWPRGLCFSLQRMAQILQMKLMFPHQMVLSVQADLSMVLQSYNNRRTCNFSRIKCHSTPVSTTVDVLKAVPGKEVMEKVKSESSGAAHGHQCISIETVSVCFTLTNCFIDYRSKQLNWRDIAAGNCSKIWDRKKNASM